MVVFDATATKQTNRDVLLIFYSNNQYTISMKIVFCGGGTAGHVTPNLALIDELSSEEIYYIGTDGMEKDLTKPYVENGIIKKYCTISAAKLQRKITIKNVALPFLLIKSIRESRRHLTQVKPDVVFSKGGYAALPVVVAAKMLKIPSIIHESDLSAGLANKVSAMFANKFLCTYPTISKAQPCGALIRKAILHGNRQAGLSTMQFDGKKPVLLVMGGSLGSKAINDVICQTPQLANTFDIFVICGKDKKLNCDFIHQKEYVTNIADIFAATDVCITRAGSNSLAELTLARVPFLAVPLTKCSRGEQKQNANWFAQKGCCIVLEEDTLLQNVKNAAEQLYVNRQAYVQKQQKQSVLFGTNRVVQIIKSYQKPQIEGEA